MRISSSLLHYLVLQWSLLICVAQTAQLFKNAVDNTLANDVFKGLEPQEDWIQQRAFIPSGDDVDRKQSATLEKAKEICLKNPQCQGICFPRPGGFPAPDEVVSVDFKGKRDIHEHEDWWTLLKPTSKGGELKKPKATSHAVLYALRCAQVLISSVPVAMGDKQAQIQAVIDDVQQASLSFISNSREIEVLKGAILRAKSYLEAPLTQAYINMIDEEEVYLGDTSEGTGLTFLPNSVDCDTKRTISLRENVEMPRVGFGTWQLIGETAYKSVMLALKAGYRHIDTAQAYRNEEDVGRAIQDFLAEANNVKRSDLFITTKLSTGNDFGTGKTRAAFMKQLQDLRLDYVDVYMIHGPQSQKSNREAWQDMEQLFDEGKIKALGISNYDEWWLDDLLKYAKHRPVYLQNKFDIYTHGLQTQTGKSMLKRANSEGIAMAGYSTLNKWPLLMSPRDDVHVLSIAESIGRTPSQVLLRWALQLGIAVLPRSSSADHISENISLFDFKLSNEQMHSINRIYLLASTHNLQFVKPFPARHEHDEL